MRLRKKVFYGTQYHPTEKRENAYRSYGASGAYRPNYHAWAIRSLGDSRREHNCTAVQRFANILKPTDGMTSGETNGTASQHGSLARTKLPTTTSKPTDGMTSGETMAARLLFAPKIGRYHPTSQTCGSHRSDRCG
jgi:hypothetical protein